MYDLYLTLMWIFGAMFGFGITSTYYCIKLHNEKWKVEQYRKSTERIQHTFYTTIDNINSQKFKN